MGGDDNEEEWKSYFVFWEGGQELIKWEIWEKLIGVE